MTPQQHAHLGPKENTLWTQFLERYATQWDRFDYDVHVGEGRPVTGMEPDYIQAMWQALTPHRIDAVGYLGRQPTIFEVTPKASRTTIGACALYQWLYMRQYPQDPPALCAVVTVLIHPDAALYFAAKNIPVFKVPGRGAAVGTS